MIAVIIRERERNTGRAGVGAVFVEHLQRKRVGSGGGHDHLVRADDEIARAVVGQRGDGDIDLVASVRFVIANVVIEPGGVAAVRNRRVMGREGSCEPIVVLVGADETFGERSWVKRFDSVETHGTRAGVEEFN